MNLRVFRKMLTFAGLTATSLFLVGRAVAQQSIKGQVLGGGAPIAQSTVTLFAATAVHPSNSHRPKPITTADLQ
jgi:hypothetical protein